jgi:hypothetical protein
MARGWESKSVEAQIEAAAEITLPRKMSLSPEAVATLHRKDGLLLSRSHVRQQLQASHNPRHRQMLEQALADIDKQLEKLV